MNCKPGDLAIVVESAAGNEGKIVRCIRLLGNSPWIDPDGVRRSHLTWEIDRTLKGWRGDRSRQIQDSQLRPIRPGDVTDEEVRDLYAPDRSMKDSPPSEAKQPNKKETV